MKAFPELAGALRAMLDRMDGALRMTGFQGEITMYLAGGVAVNFWCGTRYTADVDASFSRRIILPKDLTINYRRKDGSDAFIYFDHNYNTSFALLHERFEEDSVEWSGLGNEERLVKGFHDGTVARESRGDLGNRRLPRPIWPAIELLLKSRDECANSIR